MCNHPQCFQKAVQLYPHLIKLPAKPISKPTRPKSLRRTRLALQTALHRTENHWSPHHRKSSLTTKSLPNLSPGDKLSDGHPDLVRHLLARALVHDYDHGKNFRDTALSDALLKTLRGELSSLPEQDPIWTAPSEEFALSGSGLTQFQIKLVSDLIWRRFPAQDRVKKEIADALLPIAIFNQPNTLVRILLGWGADVAATGDHGVSIIRRAVGVPGVGTNWCPCRIEVIRWLLGEGSPSGEIPWRRRKSDEDREQERRVGRDMVRALGYVLSNIGMDLPPGKQNNPMGLPTGKEIVETLVEFGALMYLGLVDDVAPSTKLETMIDDAEPEELEKLESVGEDGHWVDHLFGSWGGVFEDIKVGEVKKNSLGLVVFSGSGTDKEGKFCMYGQAMEGYRVRFVQLYESRGVVYEGKMAWNGDADRCRTRKGALAWAIRGRCWVLSEHFYDFWEGRPSESRRRLGGRFQMVKEPRSKFRE